MSDNKDFDALLDEFIKKQLEDSEDTLAELDDTTSKKRLSHPQDENPFDDNDQTDLDEETDDDDENDESNQDDEDDFDLSSVPDIDPDEAKLQEEEKRLFTAYKELIKSASNCAREHQVEVSEFYFSAAELLPRFRPYHTDNLKGDIATCWDILIATEAEKLAGLPVNASDEQILDFAEKISAPNLQLSLISYVETLIEIDACETAYNLRKVKYQKHKIEKELYEEKQRLNEKKRLYVQAIKDHRFPVDADRLVTNFFKTAAKDPANAEKILENNPATFAPIQVDKIPNRFFGLIKAGPEDGKIVNKKLGKFLIKLKK